LAHNLQNKALVDGCTKFLCARIAETNVSEVWSAANATKNEVLIRVCAPLVAMNWEMFRASQLFYVATEVIGMMSIFRYPWMAQESATSKVKTLLKWRNASRNDDEYTARTTAFRDMVSLPGIQNTPDLISDLFVEGIDIPVEWRFV
uniref:ABC1 domain-containing protein n=1 Tax=Hymenolepis diminuta TaxID=6216 RepID=A0A0R3SYY1_HYMDI